MSDILIEKIKVVDTLLPKLTANERDAVVFVVKFLRNRQVELENEVSRLKKHEGDDRQLTNRLKGNEETVARLTRRVKAKDKKHKNSVSAAQRLRARRNELKKEKQDLLSENAKLHKEIKSLRDVLNVAIPG